LIERPAAEPRARGGTSSAERPKVAELRQALGITDDRLVARSYADLKEKRRRIVIPRR
jgi:hypothetical protein